MAIPGKPWEGDRVQPEQGSSLLSRLCHLAFAGHSLCEDCLLSRLCPLALAVFRHQAALTLQQSVTLLSHSLGYTQPLPSSLTVFPPGLRPVSEVRPWRACGYGTQESGGAAGVTRARATLGTASFPEKCRACLHWDLTPGQVERQGSRL